MNTIPDQAGGQRRRRRLHSDEFKADAVAACTQPGVSMAAVALSRGVNANLLRRWVRDAEVGTNTKVPMLDAPAQLQAPAHPPAAPAFIPVPLPGSTPAPAAKDIRAEVRRGATTIAVTWPAEAASECALWIRELLR
ncbi:MAG: IS66-like element accessory protein TnpA [Pseudomonadota bacterium]